MSRENPTHTRWTIVNGVLDRDPEYTKQFMAFYLPIVRGILRRPRYAAFRDKDADDVLQKVLEQLLDGRMKPNPEKGRFRGLLSTTIHRLFTKLKVPPAALTHDPPDRTADDVEKDVDLELAKKAISLALREFEPGTREVFELAVIRNVPQREVARQLGMSDDAVYKATSRVKKTIRAIRKKLDEGHFPSE